MKKCTGEKLPPCRWAMTLKNCAAIEKCPYRTWPVTIGDRIRSMTDNETDRPFCASFGAMQK